MAAACWHRVLLLILASGCIISEAGYLFSITTVSMSWDDRIRVCLEMAPHENDYMLMTVFEGRTTMENNTIYTKDITDIYDICLFSNAKYALDGYHELDITVTSINPNGSLDAIATKTWYYIFPSKRTSIQVAATSKYIFTSWQILTNLTKLDGYLITVYSEKHIEKKVLINDTSLSSYTIDMEVVGKHSVCVHALVYELFFKPYTSNDYCSDIVDIESDEVTLQSVKEMQVFLETNTSLFVKWNQQEPKTNDTDLSYLVTWSDLERYENMSQRLEKRHEGNDFSAMFIRKDRASTEITELPGEHDYTVCVVAMKYRNIKRSHCDTLYLGSFFKVISPVDVQYNPGNASRNSSIQWKYGAKSTNLKFWIQWIRMQDGASGYAETDNKNISVTLPPGEISISVRALKKPLSSEAVFTNASISGLIISAQQLNTQSISVTWEEWPVPIGDVHYNISLKEKDKLIAISQPIFCSGSKTDCICNFNDLGVTPPTTLTILIQNADESYVQAATTHLDTVGDVTNFVQEPYDGDYVTVSWDTVPDAKIYLLSIYPNVNLTMLRFRTVITLPTRYDLKLQSMGGNVAQIQPCKSMDHCGNIVNLTLTTEIPGPPPDYFCIGVYTLFAVGILVPVVLCLVYKIRKKLAERRRLEEEFYSDYSPILTTTHWSESRRYT